MEKSFIFYEHCERRIFSFSAVYMCPICHLSVNPTSEEILEIPSPFLDQSEPMSVTLKPTDGLFLRDYKNGSDLHIGITNSKGKIFEFDPRGVSSGACWKQFLNIHIPVSIEKEEWDLILDKTAEKFKHERYDENLMNCFSFVTSSLASIEEIAEFCKDKALFSEKFLTESTKRAAKYISVYRHIEKYGFYII